METVQLPKRGSADQAFEQYLDRGTILGRGGSRCVYAFVGRNDLVIKEMSMIFPMTNMIEWLVWCALEEMAEDILGTVQNTELQHRFAKCHSISETGRFLIMELLQPLQDDDRIDHTIYPDWLNDKKPQHFGRAADGKIKVLDYARVNFHIALNPLNQKHGLY